MRPLPPIVLPLAIAACSDAGEDPAAKAAAGPKAIDAVAVAAPIGWRPELAMQGVQYVGRIPADGSGLHVEGWRNDGGFYISDELHSVSIYSAEGRVALSAEAFRHREPDGVAAWTIADFWSWPADASETGMGLSCGYGPDPAAWSRDNTRHVVGVVRWPDVPPGMEIHQQGVIAAVEVDLAAGAITPVTTDDVWCRQELL